MNCCCTPTKKYIFDLTIIGMLAIVAVPALSCVVLLILLLDGRPVFYISKRRVYRQQAIPIVKFRTMRRDAERIANRDTMPVTSTRFLNIPIESPLYTPIGRWIERLMLTELPQLYHVLFGQMSLVGNRPLPENVIASLREEYPETEERFRAPAGLTGPVQLVGRDFISDADRLRLEITYCRTVAEHYSIWLDVRILFYTVVVGLLPGRRFAPEQVFDLLGGEQERAAVDARSVLASVANGSAGERRSSTGVASAANGSTGERRSSTGLAGPRSDLDASAAPSVAVGSETS